MSRRTIFTCQVCGKEQDKERVIDWLEIKHPDNTRVTLLNDWPKPPLLGDYCSETCLATRVKERAEFDPAKLTFAKEVNDEIYYLDISEQ